MAVGTPTVGTYTEASSGSTTSVPYPSTVNAGDLLVLLVSVTSASATATTQPAGWTTQVQMSSTGNTLLPEIAIFTKAAAGTEGGTTLTVTTTSGVARAAQILAFSGVDANTPIDVSPATADITTASTATTVTISPTTANTALVYVAALNSTAANATPPAGFTETGDRVSGTRAFEVAYMLGAPSGTNTAANTWSVSARSIGAVLALRPAAIYRVGASPVPVGRSTAGTLTPALAQTPTVGNTLIASVASNSTITAPSGWTQAATTSGTSGSTTVTQTVFYRVADGTETSPTFTLGGAGTALVEEWAGLDGTSPFDAAGTGVAAAGTQSGLVMTDSITTAGAGDLILGHVVIDGGFSISGPTFGGGLTADLARTSPVTAWNVAVGAGSYATAGAQSPSATISETSSVVLLLTTTAWLRPGAAPSPTSVSLADTATSAGALTASASVPLSDVASAGDVLAAPSASLALTDAIHAADTLTITVTTTLADTVHGADTDTATNLGQDVTLADTASAADALSYTVAVALADVAAGSDSLPTPTITAALAEALRAAESVSITVTASVAEIAQGVDAGASVVDIPLADSSAVSEAFTAAWTGFETTVGDTITASESFTVAANVTLDDLRVATEDLISGATLALADEIAWQGEAARVFTPRDLNITITVGSDRWSMGIGIDRWSLGAGADRWKLNVDPEN